ncbi:hypothetical protein ILYODFUR_035055 [Ilyodon furcidens]|uniref:Uncharacterized protein n=1 Tax=Ilyodon furcidens TaxID=33524 RepID=A0ABV0TPF2_9TELE
MEMFKAGLGSTTTSQMFKAGGGKPQKTCIQRKFYKVLTQDGDWVTVGTSRNEKRFQGCSYFCEGLKEQGLLSSTTRSSSLQTACLIRTDSQLDLELSPTHTHPHK